MEKLPGHSPDLVTKNIEQLKQLFPSVVTEGVDESGGPVEKIDFDALRQELSDHVVEGPEERFQLDWPGKRRAALAANAPIAKTLRPQRDESVDFDTTRNLFIEGDNLDVLKLLQESYLGKVKLIYIDPPYNTGNDFIYNDNFAQTTKDYLEQSGQVDEEGNRLVANTDANGRFHSDWLSMMYPRLKLARNLLADDGLLFISIGEEELASLKKLSDEVFGASNFAGIAPRKTGAGSAATRSASYLRKLCDYVLIYRRTEHAIFRRKQVGVKEYPHHDERGNYLLAQFQASGSDATRSARPNMWYPIHVLKDGRLTTSEKSSDEIERTMLPEQVNGEDGRWLWSREKFERDSISHIHYDGRQLRRKVYEDTSKDQTIYQVEKAWFEGFTNASGSKHIAEIFGTKKIFDHPKPVALLEHLVRLHPDNNALVLDFFAGSGSIGDAVMRLNATDGGKRAWIAVQLPELVSADGAAARAGYGSISELAMQRLRLVGGELNGDSGRLDLQVDTGFRSFRVDSTGLNDVFKTPDASSQETLSTFASNIKPDRSGEDLLFQVLIEWGLELSLPIQRAEIDGHEIFDVDNGALVACFDTNLTTDVIEGLTKQKPLRIVFRDDAFVDDAARINAEQTIQQIAPDTEVRVL